MSIKSSLKARIRKELIRRQKVNQPKGYFQLIKSKKDLKKAIKQIKRAKKKYPNSRIPYLRVFAAGALDETSQENTNQE